MKRRRGCWPTARRSRGAAGLNGDYSIASASGSLAFRRFRAAEVSPVHTRADSYDENDESQPPLNVHISCIARLDVMFIKSPLSET